MGKKRKQRVKNHGLKLWSEKRKPSPRVFPKRYQADYIRPKGGIDKDVHFIINLGHVKSAGVMVPESKPSKAQLLAEAFVLPRIEVERLRTWTINNDGEIIAVPWQHIVLEKTENWRFSIFWMNDKVLFVSDNTATKTQQVSRRSFKSVLVAKQFYLANGYQAIPMGPRRAYVESEYTTGR